MKSLSKKLVLMLLLFFSLTLLGVGFVGVCVAPVTVPAKPKSGPEIVSIELHSDHFLSPPQYSTHPYTGETTVISPGYYMPRGTMDIKIKNSPFTPYTDKNGNTINIYYSFYIHITDLVLSHHDLDSIWYYQLNNYGPWYSVYQSDSDYTIITFSYGVNTDGTTDIRFGREGDNIYFYVQAVTGYFDGVGEPFFGGVYEGEGSEWMEYMVTTPVTNGAPKPTSTVVVPVTPKPSTSDFNDNPLPPQQQNPWSTYLLTVIVIVCIIVVPIVIVMYHNKRHQHKRKTINSSSNPSNTQFTRGF